LNWIHGCGQPILVTKETPAKFSNRRNQMSEHKTGQVIASAAEVYEEFFLPALFQQWSERVAGAAEICPGQRVLDVACGTGVLARAAARRAGSAKWVVGLDINEGMLAVARRKAPEITWKAGRAEALPFDDNYFDAVVSQFGLMFFEERTTALREMMRVLRPGGRLAVAVWAALEQTPGYAVMTSLLARLFGESVAAALRSPFALGDPEALQAVFSEAGIPGAQVTTLPGTARFPSIAAWVHTDIKGWTLANVLSGDQFDRLLREAAGTLKEFELEDGSVSFPSPAHIVTAQKPIG
jgi:ubiquinone/menaquinone biosynthesis C-methylase UbiE